MTVEKTRTSALSRLDEAGLLGEPYTLVHADNATLVLHDAVGTEHTCTDLISAYAAVNFGHRNPAIDEALKSGSDIAALFTPAQAGWVADWLRSAAGDAGSRVLYQVGGSFAVATALALARRRRPGKICALEGAFHGLGVDSLSITSVHRNLALQDTGFSDYLDTEVHRISPGQVPDSWADISCVIYEPVQALTATCHSTPTGFAGSPDPPEQPESRRSLTRSNAGTTGTGCSASRVPTSSIRTSCCSASR